MEEAINRARETMMKDYGGPFGAVIMKNEQVIAVASNTVLRDKDATAHAEINAIREASRVLGTENLSGCVLYATGYPCPMCLSAIMWANIREVYYGTNLEDAEKIGFRDDFIYRFIRDGNSSDVLVLKQMNREACLKLFEEYEKARKIIY